jgi:hypothetical protein
MLAIKEGANAFLTVRQSTYGICSWRLLHYIHLWVASCQDRLRPTRFFSTINQASLDWFEGKLTGNAIFDGTNHGFLMFPVDFPLNESNEGRNLSFLDTRQKHIQRPAACCVLSARASAKTRQSGCCVHSQHLLFQGPCLFLYWFERAWT